MACNCLQLPLPALSAHPAGKGKGKVGESDAQMEADEEFARALQVGHG